MVRGKKIGLGDLQRLKKLSIQEISRMVRRRSLGESVGQVARLGSGRPGYHYYLYKEDGY